MKTYLKETPFAVAGENLAQLPDGELPELRTEIPKAEPPAEPPRPARRKRRILPVILAVAALCGAAALAARAYLPRQTAEPVVETEVAVPAPVLEEVVTYTAVFTVGDEIVETVTYPAGAETVEEPAVPEKEGYIGAWEDYVLDGDVTISAAYTYAPWRAVVCGDDLKIFVQPDAESDTVRTLEVGDTVKILAETVVDDEVWYETKRGWLPASCVAEQGTTVAETLGFSMEGDWPISAGTVAELRDAIRVVTDRGYETAFMLVDLASGKSISWNTEQVFYCASTIKGPYVCAVLNQYPEAAAVYEGTILDVLVNSSNSGYTTLRNQYGKACLTDWCEEAGVKLESNKKWPGITAEQLCRLWMQNHVFFTTTEVGAETAAWFETPADSPIRAVLGETYKTQTKAGWISGSNAYYCAASDAGIVHADSGTYVVAILSNVPADLTAIEPLAAALDRAHDEMN